MLFQIKFTAEGEFQNVANFQTVIKYLSTFDDSLNSAFNLKNLCRGDETEILQLIFLVLKNFYVSRISTSLIFYLFSKPFNYRNLQLQKWLLLLKSSLY